MIEHRRIARIGLTLGCAQLSGLLTGCATLMNRPAPSPPLIQRDAPLAAGNESQPDSPDVLAAVEEFLERTRDYNLPGGDKPSPSFNPRGGASSHSFGGPSASMRSMDDADTSPAVANGRVTLEVPSFQKPTLALPVVQAVRVRRVDDRLTPNSEAVRLTTTNQAIEMTLSDTHSIAEQYLESLKQRATEQPDFDSEWALRFVQLAMGLDPESTDVAPTLPDSSRSILAALIRSVSALRGVARDPLARADQALDYLDDLRHRVAQRSDPVVAPAALCSKVVTFGVYEELTEVDLVAGRTIRAIVYTEIGNLQSERTDDHLFRTTLSTRLEVLTADGTSIWEHEESEIMDHCRRRRVDFFVAQRMTLPPTLPAGEYVLKVLVEDKVSGKVDESTRSFTIHSPLSVANSG